MEDIKCGCAPDLDYKAEWERLCGICRMEQEKNKQLKAALIALTKEIEVEMTAREKGMW